MSPRHTATARRQSDRGQTPELSVYDGREHLGFIRRQNGQFVAIDAHNRELGRFATLRNAVRAIPKRAEQPDA